MAAKMFSLCVYEYGHADPNLVDYIYLVRKKSVVFLMFAASVHRWIYKKWN